MITLEKIANWNSQQNPLEKVLGQNSVSPCVTARGAGEDHSGMILYCDELKETTNLRSIFMGENKVNRIGGLYDKNGQTHQAGSIYDKDGLAPTLDTASGGNRQPFIVEDIEYIPLDEQNKYLRQDGCVGTLTTDGNSPKHNNRIVEYEPNLKQQLCDKLIQNRMVQEYDIIRHSYSTNRLENGEKNMGRVENHEHLSPTLDTRCDCLGVCVKDDSSNSIYTDTEKQLFTEDGNIRRYIGSDKVDEFKEGQMATTSFPNGYGHGPRTHDESITLNCIDKPSVKQNYRIRKLTPKECGRLMGVKDEDIDKMSVNQSNSKLYHLYGDSIVTNCLCEIFKQML